MARAKAFIFLNHFWSELQDWLAPALLFLPTCRHFWEQHTEKTTTVGTYVIHKWLWLCGFWWGNMENDCIKHCYLFTWLCTGQSICSHSVPPVRKLNSREGRLDALPHCSKRCCHFVNHFRLFLITASFIPVHGGSGDSLCTENRMLRKVRSDQEKMSSFFLELHENAVS